MSAVLHAREPCTRYLESVESSPLVQFDLLATAQGGVARLRELILSLAVQGKLVPQIPSDEPASELLQRIHAEKEQLVAVGKLKTARLNPKVAEDEMPFAVPDSWIWTRLGSVTKKITDGTHHSPANFAVGDFKYLSAKNIKSWGIDLSDVTYVPSSVHQEIFSRCDPEYGDILYIKDGATTGVLTINTLKEQFSLLSSVGVIKPSCGVTSEYLALLMRSPFFYQAMRDGMTGVAITRVTLAKLGTALVPLPPLAEQTRIVARVDELMRLCDTLEEKDRLEVAQHTRLLGTLLGTLTDSTTPEELVVNWQRVAEHFDLLLDRPEAVGSFERTILQLAVRGLVVRQDETDEHATAPLQRLLDERAQRSQGSRARQAVTNHASATNDPPFDLPPGWAWATAQDICSPSSIITYGILKPEWIDAGVPTVRVQDIQAGNLLVDQLGQCSPARAAKFSKTTLREGDLLIAKDGATLGKTAFVPKSLEGGNITQHVLRFSIAPEFNRDYVRLVIDSPHGQAWMLGETQGVALPGVNVGDFRRMPVPVPPVREQARIVARVTELRRLCADLRQRLIAARATQEHLADALVESAVT